MRILVVDDELVSREKMKRIMSSLGECDEVTSGQDALKAFMDASAEQKQYDLITLDISMPEMDGTEVLKGSAAWRMIMVFPKKARSRSSWSLRHLKRILFLPALNPAVMTTS